MMNHKVPGGRRRTVSDGDVLERECDETPFFVDSDSDGRPTSVNKHDMSDNYGVANPTAAKPNTPCVRKSTSELDSEFSSKSEKKMKGFKKHRMKSFSSFMQKAMRSFSNSVSNNSPRRSQSMKEKFQHQTENKENDVKDERHHDESRSSSTRKSPSVNRPIHKKNVFNNFYGNKVPGIEGLRNHGNTCFMNAVLQCLSHTDILAEYFVTDQYKADITRGDKSNAKKFGSKGEVTEHLAVLLKSLWSCQYTPEISSEFKSVVGKYGSQYRGYAQHDAQEFFLWLLDKVHEDLNTAAKKKYRANKGSHGRSDDLVAAEALANHMRNNNSFVYDLFQALYRSSLRCPRCERQSNTFDPFLCVSLPIPQKKYRPVFVTVVYLDAQPKQVRIGLMMDWLDKVKDLRQKLAEDTGIPGKQLMLTEIYYDGFHRTFRDNQPLSDIHETDGMFAIQLPVPYIETLKPDQYPERDFIIVVLLNKVGVGPSGRKFGYPVVMQLPRDSTFVEIEESILRHMRDQVKPGVLQQRLGVIMKLKAIDDISGKFYLPHDVDHPLYTEAVDRALSFCAYDGLAEHVKLVAEWDAQVKQSLLGEVNDFIEEHVSVRQAKQSQQSPGLSTLDECFDLYTKEEKLGPEDAWICSNCKKRQLGTIKSLNLWSLPDILVIHLKRFKQVGLRRTKLNNLVSFPVTGLNMSKHNVKRGSDSQLMNMYLAFSPWRRQRLSTSTDDDSVYDLYAVCNHYGNMLGGHYTAFCKNPVDDQWYSFDDTKVTSLQEDQIITRAAYMLFYQRRSLVGLSSSSGSSNSSMEGHWLMRMVPFKYSPQNKALSKSEETLLDEAQKDSASESSKSVEATPAKQTLRTISSYGTLHHGTKSPVSSHKNTPFKSHSFIHRHKNNRKSLDPPRSPPTERSSSYSGHSYWHSPISSGWISPAATTLSESAPHTPSAGRHTSTETKSLETGPVMQMPTSPKNISKMRSPVPEKDKLPISDTNTPVLSQPARVSLPSIEQPSRVAIPPMNQVVRPKTPNTLNTQVSPKSPPVLKKEKSPPWSKSSKSSNSTAAKSPTAVVVNRYPSSASKTPAYRGRSYSASSKMSDSKGSLTPEMSVKSNDSGSPDYDYFVSETCV